MTAKAFSTYAGHASVMITRRVDATELLHCMPIDSVETWDDAEDLGLAGVSFGARPAGMSRIWQGLRPVNELEDLYLSLLKRTLTRYGLEGDWRYVRVDAPMPRSLRQQMASRVARVIRAAGYEIVRREQINPTRPEGRHWPRNAETMIGLVGLNQLHAAVDDVIDNGVPGDLIETGAWRGGACILMRAVLAARGITDRTVWVADSFEGLPKPSAEYPEYIEDGMPFWGVKELSVSQAEVEANFAKYGLLDGQVRFLKGWFRDTLPGAPIDRLAVLRLDGDLYESTFETLVALYEKVSPGGYVIIDDYHTVKGCHDAVNDFRRDRHVSEPVIDIDYAPVYWKVTKPDTGKTSVLGNRSAAD